MIKLMMLILPMFILIGCTDPEPTHLPNGVLIQEPLPVGDKWPSDIDKSMHASVLTHAIACLTEAKDIPLDVANARMDKLKVARMNLITRGFSSD